MVGKLRHGTCRLEFEIYTMILALTKRPLVCPNAIDLFNETSDVGITIRQNWLCTKIFLIIVSFVLRLVAISFH